MSRMTEGPVASEAEVKEFLATTRFEPYQSVPLPHGLRTPGKDRSKIVDLVLGDRVEGKAVLDVGTFYGLYPSEAMRRGAAEAVGVEAHPRRYEIARAIAELKGTYTVLRGMAEEMDFGRTFDIVLFLNVLHHVLDPIHALRTVARHCSDTLIVEFGLPSDLSRRSYFRGGEPSRSFYQWPQGYARSWLLRTASQGCPVILVGNRPHKNTFYFSREAFYNLFVVQHELFSDIEFLPSVRKHRTVAFCKIR